MSLHTEAAVTMTMMMMMIGGAANTDTATEVMAMAETTIDRTADDHDILRIVVLDGAPELTRAALQDQPHGKSPVVQRR